MRLEWEKVPVGVAPLRLKELQKLCRPEKEEEVCNPHTHFLCLTTSKLVQNWSPVQLTQTFLMSVRLLCVRPHGPAMRCREQRHLERKESSIDHRHTDTHTAACLAIINYTTSLRTEASVRRRLAVLVTRNFLPHESHTAVDQLTSLHLLHVRVCPVQVLKLHLSGEGTRKHPPTAGRPDLGRRV